MDQHKKKLITYLVVVGVVSAFAITQLALLITNLTVSFDSVDILKHLGDPVSKVYKSDNKPLTKQFASFTAGNVQDQGSRGTCWGFATMRFLEAQYRVQGLQKGLLKENQYVQFSDQAHGINMINFCKENPEKCPDTPGAQGHATDGYPSWIYHFQDYLNDKLVVNLQSCPYYPGETDDHSGDMQCDGMKEFQDTKSLKYNVSNYKYLQNINSIKQELVKRDAVFPLVTEVMFFAYHIPCTGDLGYNAYCLQEGAQLVLCPPQLQRSQNFSDMCVVNDLMTTADAEFVVNNFQKVATGGAHAMLLVGYNDEYAFRYNKHGGFIVQNSWGPAMSHSLDYLLGKVSRRDEDFICPNVEVPTNWVPIDHEGEDKWKLRGTTILTYTGFVKKAHFHTSQSKASLNVILDKLLVKNTRYYAIQSISQSVGHTVRVRMGYTDSMEEALSNNFSISVELPAMMFDLLAFYFSPQQQTGAENSAAQCGYYIIPYDYVDWTIQNQGLWFVDFMDVKFDDSSFVRDSDKDDGSKWIREATLEQNRVTFESHTPWLDDETQQPKFK